jgi:hypothetical protein
VGVVAGLLALAANGFGLAQAQGATARVSIDAPGSGATVGAGQPVFIGGWAADTAGLGTGVNGVDIYLDGPPSSGRLLGSAEYGIRRPDVASVLGRPALTNSGFNYVWVPRGVPVGEHMIYVAARTQAGSVVVESIAVTVLGTSEAGCSFLRPCFLGRSSIAWEVDMGGPGTRFEYFHDRFDER